MLEVGQKWVEVGGLYWFIDWVSPSGKTAIGIDASSHAHTVTEKHLKLLNYTLEQPKLNPVNIDKIKIFDYCYDEFGKGLTHTEINDLVHIVLESITEDEG